MMQSSVFSFERIVLIEQSGFIGSTMVIHNIFVKDIFRLLKLCMDFYV